MAYKRILVPIDGSETSEMAVKEAVKIAKDFNAKLRIVHVSDEFIGYIEGLSFDLDQYVDSMRKHGQSILDKMKNLIVKSGIQPEIQLIEITDTPASIPEKIIEEANTWNAQLLVVGTHGRSGFSRMILGSVADALIRLTHVPILLVHSEEKK
jgi:nucleotide-binding universal stress UspA family protein